MKIHILASGSKGNCTYIEIGNHKILIDAGLSMKQFHLRLAEKGIEIDRLDAVFITHEHSDHIGGLATLYRKYNMPIYLSQGTCKNLGRATLEKINPSGFRYTEFGVPILLEGYSVLPFMTYHDALEPSGYRFTEASKSLVYMTDTGYFPENRFDLLRNADLYIIESNHDPDLLLDSERPWILKRRILDDQGHLSNEDSAYLMMNVLGENTKQIILAHLSEECNTEEDALSTYRKIFDKQGLVWDDFKIICAKQNQSMDEIVL